MAAEANGAQGHLSLSRSELTRAAGRIGGATLISRLLGLARDILFAALFGTSQVADAFNLAFRLPNTLRLALGEGAVRAAFVPVYSATLTQEGPKRARQRAGRAVAVWAVTLGLVSALGAALAGPIVHLYAIGWTEETAALGLAVSLTRFLFPFILLAGMTALLSGFLNAHHLYGIPALAPVALNIGFLAVTAVALPFMHGDMTRTVWAFSVGAMVGGAAQIVIQIPSLRRIGFEWRHLPRLVDPGVRRMGTLMIPAVMGLAVFQINTLVDTMLATRLGQGSVTALTLANRVMLMPQGVVGIAVATAMLPSLSSLAAAEERERLRATLGFSMRMVFAVLLPAAFGLALLARPVVSVLFEHGAFGAENSTPLTASALFFYALGLPAFGAVKVIGQAFFAFQDSRTPFGVGVVAMVANIVLNLLLMGPLGVGGLALATSLSGFLNLALLAWFLRPRLGGVHPRAFVLAVGRVIVISGVAVGCAKLVHDALLAAGWLEIVSLPVGVCTAIVLYALLGWAMRAGEVTLLWEAFRKRRG
jgi:putative peptidoglycan lipid II flippase